MEQVFYVKHPMWGTMDQMRASSAKQACAKYMRIHRELRGKIVAVDAMGRTHKYHLR